MEPNDIAMSWDSPSRKSSLIPTPSGFLDLGNQNSAFSAEEFQQVGSHRYMIQRRNTKIFLEGIPELPEYKKQKYSVSAESMESQHSESGIHFSSLTWLLSGLYAMLVFDIGLVMKLSQFIAVDITAIDFNWYFIVMYGFGIVWMFSYQPLLTSCFKFKERLKMAKSNHTNNLWLKGLLALFGLAIIIKDGLVFIAFLKTTFETCAGRVLYATVPVFNTVFILAQINFLFRFSKVFTQKFKTLTKFGLMHVVATNLTIWIGLVIDESAAAVLHSDDGSHSNNEPAEGANFLHDSMHTNGNLTVGSYAGSHHEDMLFPGECHCEFSFCSTVAVAQAFLFPFVIEFSLVASCLIYIAWKNVGKIPQMRQYIVKPSYKLYNTFKGVLAGCLMLFITILVVIMLGIGKSSSHGSEEHSDTRLINVYNIFYVILESLMIISTAGGFYLFHKIKQDTKADSDQLDVVLLIICLIGPLVHGMFSMFGIALSNLEAKDSTWALSFVLPLLDILQCLSQVVFLIVGLHRKPITSQEEEETAAEIGRRVDEGVLRQEEPTARRRQSDESSFQETRSVKEEIETSLSSIGETTTTQLATVPESSRQGSIIQTRPPVRVIAQLKITPPGKRRRLLRDIIIFLLITNFCLWVFLSLEGVAFDVKFYQDAYYGNQVWTIISMICRPLNIFFRMHSAACLFEMWSYA